MKKLLFAVILFLAATFQYSAQETDASLNNLYRHYLNLKTALTKDDFKAGKLAAKDFAEAAAAIDFKLLSEGNVHVLLKDATAIFEAGNLTAQRNYFFNLSDNMAAIAKEYSISDKEIYVQYCPMAKGYWLSDAQEIKNPYYGAQMLSCGSVSEIIKK